MKKMKPWVLPTVVGIIVFIVVQGAIVASSVLNDNPLPTIASWTLGTLRAGTMMPSGSVIDDTLEAELTIQRLGIIVPIVWSTSTRETDLQQDLERGALRYPGTPEPGNIGNAFITAHSSDYPWKKGMYKKAFAKLGKLEVGDDDIIVTYKKDGVVVRELHFKVTMKKVVQATDTEMIEQRDAKEMTLVTCWPVGTNLLRLMVKTQLVEI